MVKVNLNDNMTTGYFKTKQMHTLGKAPIMKSDQCGRVLRGGIQVVIINFLIICLAFCNH